MFIFSAITFCYMKGCHGNTSVGELCYNHIQTTRHSEAVSVWGFFGLGNTEFRAHCLSNRAVTILYVLKV